MNAVAWPDVAVGFIVVFGALKGLKRGFVNEVTGAFALAFAIGAAFAYGGNWDRWVAVHTHLGPGTAHVLGMVLYACVAYAIVLVLGAALSTIAKLPLIGTANALLGSIVGAVKAAVFVWAVLYVALFFPLSGDLRDDLHHARLVAVLQEPNGRLDGTLRATLPAFVRPYADALFARHRV